MASATDQASAISASNPTGLLGIEFIEFSAPDAAGIAHIANTLKSLGCSREKRHKHRAIDLFRQNRIRFLLNSEANSFAKNFAKAHGQSACAMAFRVEDAQHAFKEAVKRGAKPVENLKDHDLPAVYGIGDSLIYFVDHQKNKPNGNYFDTDFETLEKPETVSDKGFVFIDHLTNNVFKGTMGQWSDFYKGVFGFTEIQYFDIKGQKTGLTSFALKSPCKTFSIPINEGNESKSQIEEYLRDYNGAGIQHIALASQDLLASLDKMTDSGIAMLDIDDEYYEEAFQRVPNVTEDKKRIMKHRVLIDGDTEGYLLQIFTKNVFGPIFFELIQRKNHHAFGEGNFGALFRSIERDQERRGVL